MMTNDQPRQAPYGKPAIYALIAALVVLVIVANWHLVYVAVTSQPDCVAHNRQDAGTVGTGAFRAAQSACTPP